MSREISQKKESDKYRGQNVLMHFRVSSLAAILFLGIAAIALAYIGGVMSGRHGNHGNLTHDSAVETVTSFGPAEVENERILTAEELEFAHELRRSGNQVADKARANRGDTPSTSGEVAASEQTPPAPNIEEIVKNISGIQDYIFQAGTFREESGADSLRQKLEGYGLRTKLERNGKFFVVLIMLRGDNQRALEVLGIARELKLGQLILRSRKQPQ